MALSSARAGDAADGVTVKGGTLYVMQGDQLAVLTDSLKLPFEVEVITNGNFTVAKGQARRLLEGQVIRSDGWLLNPDGSIQPVMDHVAMTAGKAYVVRDGRAEPLAQTMVFKNNLSIAPDGYCTYPDGNRSRLLDGQWFRLDGTAIPAKDTITLKNGRVVVQKGGTLLTLTGIQIMGMNDGTRVHGDGSIQRLDGTTTRLREGQTILVDGPIVRH